MDFGSPLWLIIDVVGVILLGAVIAYAIMKNRQRSPAEKRLTEEATRRLYRRTDRDDKREAARR
jgi:hypothetical protein